nr:microtubule-actin cross-linking factor 1 isoform X6 [Halyomorpha halys]
MSFLERQADGTIDKQAYEENLSKFKDERDAIQKKTFTKWVNKHLKKAHRHVNDLFTDLQDGHNLISLLEVLSGEQLPREKGRMRFHMLQNVELVLNFLRYKKIKLVNIRPEDIVDGNPKLTLGLIWTIILHFQISDIVVGEEPNVSAKDVLLRWAKKSTAKYPGVKVSDFTSSWRDGLAFNAIIHRNRPDLLPEWREIRRRTVRERLETAFYTAEKVGVTRLLDPEDVDTHEIDEKSIITYISSMYDVFPEPPFAHPLYDNEAQALTSEYREVASSLHLWIREKISEMSQDLPSNYDELRRLAHDSAKFRSEEVPARLRDRQKLSSLYRDLQKLYESTGEVEIEPELHIDVLEKNWSKLQSLHQERDHAIQEELKKLDRLQRLAEKVSRDCKRLEPRMDDLESRISDEAKRLDRLHPLDAKHVVDSIESELRSIEENIQSLFQDVSTLKAGGHHQYPELNKRVGRLHSRWVQLRSALHSKLITRLASLSFPVVEERTVTRQTRTVLETRLVDTNHHFRALQEAIDWVKSKLKQLQEFEFSSDLSGAKIEMTHHQREHREIDRFQSTVDQCASAKSQFHGEELSLYTQHLSTLQKIYAELLSLSNKRISEFETYVDFLESITTQLAWLKEKESIEVARDWSDKEVNITAIQQYYENLMAELERAEVVVRSLLERGESLLLQGHPASKAISVVLGSLQSAWSRVLQFTLALETHIATTRTVQNFFRDLEQLRDWIHSRDEILNTTYSASEFSLDEGERLLRGMQELREELNSRSTALSQMAERAQSVAPIKQRRQPVVRPIQVTAVCDYKSDTVEIEKGDQWILHDNSALTKWRVSPIGSTKDTNVPGVVFLIPPPSKEAKEAVESLARDFDRTTALWQRKQLRLRQNMIFTTIRVVRSWDLAQFVAMGSEQRNAIRKALNEDADKLLAEGDPNDPQLRRLRREMAEVNRLFDEFEALANQQEENKNAIRAITEKCSHLQEALEEAERVLTMRLSSSIPRDVHSLEHLIVQHKEFETSLKGLTGEIEGLQSMFNSLTRKTPGVQSRVEAILQQWNHIWNYSHLFVERLKCVEITLSALDDATNVVSELELKLSSFGDMPSDLESLQNVHDDLIRVQNSIAAQQPVVDQLIEDATNTRRLVVKSRERLRSHDHSDMDRLDDDVNAVTQRWNNLCASLVDRLRCCEAAYSLLDTYGKTYQTEVKFIDESYSELNNLPPVSHGKHHIEPTKVLFTSIVERTQPLEQVNIDGGRFIREAKIYNLALGKFRAAVAIAQPSFDGDSRPESEWPSGEEEIAEQLDKINHRYLALVSILQDRLRQICAISNDPQLREFVSKLQPAHLKTFRTEFTLTETSTQLPDRWRITETDSMGINGSKPPSSPEKTGIGTDVINRTGIYHPTTGAEMTVSEAIKARILDVRTGRINLSPDKSIDIQEGVVMGIIAQALASELLGPSNISGSKNLLEAIQKELSLAEGSPLRVCLSDAIDLGLVSSSGYLDRETGRTIPLESAPLADIPEIVNNDIKLTVTESIESNVLPSDVIDARNKGLIQRPQTLYDILDLHSSQENHVDTIFGSLTLQECINKKVLDFDSFNSILDIKSGKMLTLKSALETGVITEDWQFKDTKSNRVIDLKSAIDEGYIASVIVRSIFDIDCFKNFETGEFVSFNKAVALDLLQNGELVTKKSGKTVPIKDALKDNLVKKNIWEILDRKVGIMSGGKELTLFGAAFKCYIDPKTGFVLDRRKNRLCYKDALDKKIITKEGLSVLKSCLAITVTETKPLFKKSNSSPVKQGLKKILDTLAMKKKDELPDRGMPLKEAIDKGLFDPNSGLFHIPGTDRLVSFEECLRLNILDPNSGVLNDGKKTLTFIRAIEKKIMTPLGEFEGMSLSDAISKGFIIFEGEPYEISKGAILDPTSGLIVYADSRKPEKLLEAVCEGLPAVIKDPKGNPVDLQTAKETFLSNERYDPEGLNLTPMEAIKQGFITFKPVASKLSVDRFTTAKDFILRGLFDPRTSSFTDTSGKKISFTEVVDYIDPHTLVKDLETGEFIPIKNAKFDENGEMIDPRTGRSVPFFTACKLNWIRPKKTAPKPKFGLQEAVDKGILGSDGFVTHENIKVPLFSAIADGILDCDKIGIIANNNLIPVSKAVESNILDLNKGKLESDDLILRFQKGDVRQLEKPVALEALIKKGLATKGITDPITKDSITLQEAIRRYIVDPDISFCKDTVNDEFIDLNVAIDRGVIKYKFKDTKSGSKLLLPEALERQLIITKLDKMSIVNALQYFKDGKFLNPKTGEMVTLNEALKSFIDSSSTKFKDPKNDAIITVEEALESGLLDGENSILTYPYRVPLDVAYSKGILLPSVAPMTLAEALIQDLYDPVTGKLMIEGSKTILQCLKENLITDSPLILGNGDLISLKQAIDEGLIDPNSGMVVVEGDSLNLKEALEQGHFVTKRLYPVPEAVRKLYNPISGKFTDPTTCNKLTTDEALDKVLDQSTTLVKLGNQVKTFEGSVKEGQFRNIDLKHALDEGIIMELDRPLPFAEALKTLFDPDSSLFLDPDGSYVPLEEAILLGLVDGKSEVETSRGVLPLEDAIAFGLVNSSTIDGVDLRVLARRPISLQEAVVKFYKNKKFPQGNLRDAISDGFVDDTRLLCYSSKPLSLREAKQSGIIDDCRNTICGMDLSEGLMKGLIINLEGPFSLYDALKFGFYQDRFVHPNSGKIMNLTQAVEEGFIDPSISTIKTPNDNYIILDKSIMGELDKGDLIRYKNEGIIVPHMGMDLEEAIRSKLFKNGKFIAPLENKKVGLNFGIKSGLLNPDTTYLSYAGRLKDLNQSLNDGLVDAESCVVRIEEGIPFDEAFHRGILITVPRVKPPDVPGEDTMMFKDTAKRRLLRLADARRKGLVDSAGRALDTLNSKLLDLDSALETGLIVKKISLMDALDYNLYNPTTGRFNDPFSVGSVQGRKRLTLSEAIDVGLIDPKSVLIRFGGEIHDLPSAIRVGAIDPHTGKIIDGENQLDFLKGKAKGYFIVAQSRQAMEEKYKLCDDNLQSLLEWIGEIEARLAQQEPVQEDLDRLRNQINILKLLKEELDSQQRMVFNCLEEVRTVASTGNEYLTRDEVSTLERNGKSLRSRYDRAIDRTDKLLKRLTNAGDHLSKFKSETKSLTEWMTKAKRQIEEKERQLSSLNANDTSVRELLGDVIAHQADLRFISMAANKFYEESKEFLSTLNDFRTSLQSRLSHIDYSLSGSEIKGIVNKVSNEYRDLLSRANALSDKVTGLNAKKRDFDQALERLRQWMSTAEPRANKALSEPLAADPHGLEEQLNRAKTLNNEFLAQGRLVDNMKQALDSLPKDPSITGPLEATVSDLARRYSHLSESLSNRCGILESALAQSQGVEDSLDSITSWLSSAENSLKSLSRPASLLKDRLEDQIRELRLLLSDIDTHRDTVDGVVNQAKALVGQQSNHRLAKRVETKLKDVLSRFEKLSERASKRSELLGEITAGLTSFSAQASETENWLTEANELLSTEGSIESLLTQRESKREIVEKVLREGRALVSKKDVTDTGHVRDRLKNIESSWRELNTLLDERQRLIRSRAEHTQSYEKLRDQVLSWLQSMESRIASLEPTALQMEVLKRQAEEIKPLIKEHKEYASTVDRLFDIGSSLESMARSDSPTRRRSSTSPIKRISSSSLLRRNSQEGSPSPTKSLFNVTSPLSTASSGFGSRRSSQDIFHVEEVTGVQQELSEINNRYSSIGVKVNERLLEIDNCREELRKATESLKSLDSFLERISRSQPREGLPNGREEADKINRVLKGLVEEMYEKQSALDSTRTNVNELLRKRPGAIGSDQLSSHVSQVATKWRSLHDSLKARIQFVEDVKDVYDSYELLSNWLSAKERMFAALGPISPDPRMVQIQIDQVQVLREEMRATRPQLDHLVTVCSSVAGATPDGVKLRAKVSGISDRWEELSRKLEDRASSLGAAVDSSRDFDSGLTRLKDALSNISLQVDAIPSEPSEESLRKIQGCERQLEGVRQLLADAEAAGAELCRVLTDPASRSDIQAKLGEVNKQYSLLQAKLDLRKAEIEALVKDGKEFDAAVAKTLGWVSDSLTNLSDRLLISADRDILQQQVDNHEPIYREMLSKEHEVVLLLERGGKREVESLRQQWERLRREATDRQTRLQTCMEHCRKYYKGLEAFIPWLSQVENKLESLSPESFSRRDLDKHLRDLASLRNDVWKKSGEFEHLRSLGETFIGACDVDKDVVTKEISAIRERWDRLNNDLVSKTSRLEELGRRLAETSERLRGMSHSIQRCEDRLGTHDSLSTTADPATLMKLKTLKDEVQALRAPLSQLNQTCEDLDRELALEAPGKQSGLMEEVVGLGERLDDLSERLRDRCSTAESAAVAAQQYNERVRLLTGDMSALEMELEGMKPPGRDFKTLRAQHDQLSSFNGKLSRASDAVSEALALADRLVDSGLSTEPTRRQADVLSRQLIHLEERAKSREEDLDKAESSLRDYESLYNDAISALDTAEEELRRLRPVGSEVETLRSQQAEARITQSDIIEPAGKAVDVAASSGRALIASAGPGVSVTHLASGIDQLRSRWEALNAKMVDRTRKLDSALLQSGKFQEALEGLARWLSDTEEMVANQRPPSADYNVVKAQLQEQKFLIKMINDREESLASLAQLGDEMEGERVSGELRRLQERFNDLSSGSRKRMCDLEAALAAAKLMQDKLVPVVEWMEKAERKVKDMELVPTDEEKIQQRIREHDALHSEILRKKPSLSELTEVGSDLMALVGEDEASGVADRVQDLADRYSALVDASDNIGRLLESSRTGLRHLVLTYQGLQGWMEDMENRLGRHRILAVHTDKLLAQMEDLADLTEEISQHQIDVDGTVDSGLELMKHISSDEAIQLKEKLDSLQRRYNSLTTRGAELLKQAQEGLPLVQQFHNAHGRLVDWIQGAEAVLQSAEPREESINALESDIQEFRPVVENINQIGPQLCSLSPGEGASTIEGLVTRDNRRFDAVCDQIQRKAERLHMYKQRSLEVLGDIDSLLEWFREAEAGLREAEPPSSEANIIRLQLKEHRALSDDIASQRGRVRDVLVTAKKVIREASPHDDSSLMRDKMTDLREAVDTVWSASGERLATLEQALGLAEHLAESHAHLSAWLGEMETSSKALPPPSIRPDVIAQQQDRTELLLQSIAEHKPLVDKLNKTGEALIGLVAEDEGVKVHEILDSDNSRYERLKASLRERQGALEQALQESSRATDKLEGMLRALASTADELSSLGPVSAHPPRLREQIKEVSQLSDQLSKREEAFRAVKKAAEEVISKAQDKQDPAVKDVRRKLEKLGSLWEELQTATSARGASLQRALEVAGEFWAELESVMGTLADLEASLASQQPPAVRPQAIVKQQQALQEIKAEIDQTKPEVEVVRKRGEKLMSLCGDADKPEVRKHIEDLDTAWDNVTAAFARREENLIHAMERAMEFHGALDEITRLLSQAEERFSRLGPIGADIKTVKKQIEELKEFKADVDPHMVKVEALNRQAGDLSERTSAEESQALRGPLSSVNSRWDTLTRGMAERARHLEQSLLRLGQFQHALSELIAWIDATDKTLDEEIRPTAGDPHLLEVQLAKLKVLVNDIQAHQSSVDTLNDAGRQLVETGQGSLEASTTQEKLKSLNRRWDDLLGKVASRRSELEEALRDAQRFNGEVQDMFGWLAEVDAAIAASKPAGGLPETASEQLERFMEIYNDLESARPKVEALLTQGNDYLKRAEGNNAQGLSANLKALKQRWEAVQGRANDKKIKLEIALKEATEFHNALQSFVDWLTSAEKTLANLKPVSRVLETILTQIEEHKLFQKEVGVHRETMIQLDKKGTHLKYFSQKQDVILIKNLLISVQHRWERVVSKSAERTRALDHGYKEAKEFHDLWSNLMNWLSETDKKLDEITTEIAGAGNDPVKLKARLAKHKETQKAIAQKQGAYDQTMRVGKTLRERAPKSDESKLKTAVSQLRELWSLVSSKAVTGQRKLEEALLYCGQFKEALESLLDWLKRTEKTLSQETRIYGDLDTVQNLIEQHKVLEEELRNRSTQMESLERSGRELSERADSTGLKTQLIELNKLWTTVVNLASDRSTALKAALKHAEELHKAVHMLLEWLSDAEMRLRFVDSLPDDEAETRVQIAEHDKFMREMTDKEKEKDSTIALAEKILAKAHPDGAAVIKHWITIIQSRWEEVSSWAKQRSEKLHIHLNSLRDMDTLLEELLSWLALRESDLLEKESRDLPNIIPETERLIVEHDSFMEETMTREVEVNSVFRAKQLKEKKTTKKTSKDETRQSTQELNEIQRRQSMKSSREHLTNLDRRTSRSSPAQDMIDGHPRIGPKFPPKGSKTLEPQFRCARSRLLYERWRGVWQQSWERQRRLRDHLAHLQELDRLANFSWDDWRKRFLKFMNHKKSRLTDLFRKMDKNNDGLIPRDDFIDGIIKTKFDTSKLEMGAVADMFDHNSEGYIDWKEFIAALRPDWEERKPATEAEKIHDEVKRLVMLCTCRQKFRVFQVGEGKYRFGDSQKLRLVRILRSTVMVRVGGGWVALEEFLVKNDPCRAGELLSELMPIFESLRAKEALPCAFPLSVVGQQGHSPHTCRIREKSERSVPMSGRRSTESGRSPGSTPGSAPSSRPASRSGSRPGSRPISRHSSSLSLATSEEGTPSRIPRWSRGKPSVNGSGGTRTQIPESSSSTSSISSRSFSGSSIPRPIRSPAGTKTPTARRESFKL